MHSTPHEIGSLMTSETWSLRKVFSQSYFKPKTWHYWRTLAVCFFLASWMGHWMEVPYCGAMDVLFGIVDDNYATVLDPWWVPYRIYGYAALVLNLVLEPFKEHFIRNRKTLWGAFIQVFLNTIALACILELTFGLIINQPDANGVYPFWDNSNLPGNILGQAWIVNDVFIGLVIMFYLWIMFPFVSCFLKQIDQRVSNVIFVVLCVLFFATTFGYYGFG